MITTRNNFIIKNFIKNQNSITEILVCDFVSLLSYKYAYSFIYVKLKLIETITYRKAHRKL